MVTKTELKSGDILLSTGSSGTSAAIRIGTGSRYSHAALYVGDGQVIEAVGSGVSKKGLEQATSDDTVVSVYRRIQMSDAQAIQVARYANEQIGKKYDHAGAVGSSSGGVPGMVLGVFLSPIVPAGIAAADLYNTKNPEARFFCSELVALAFERAGVPLGSGSASTTPQDIAKSHDLNYVGELELESPRESPN